MMKKCVILFLIISNALFSFAQKSSFATQTVYFTVELNWLNDSTAMIRTELKNISGNPIFIYLPQELNFCNSMTNFVGIGLYAHFFPHLPPNSKRFDDSLQLKVIKPSEIIKLEQKCILSRDKTLRLHLDYFKNFEFDKFETINIGVYDYNKHMETLEMTMTLD